MRCSPIESSELPELIDGRSVAASDSTIVGLLAARCSSGLEVKPSGLMCVTRRSFDDGRMTLTISVHCIARVVDTIVGIVEITRRS